MSSPLLPSFLAIQLRAGLGVVLAVMCWVRGHGSAKVAYESTFQFPSPVNELHAVFVMVTADI